MARFNGVSGGEVEREGDAEIEYGHDDADPAGDIQPRVASQTLADGNHAEGGHESQSRLRGAGAYECRVGQRTRQLADCSPYHGDDEQPPPADAAFQRRPNNSEAHCVEQ
jgi:hypothetical protein